MPESDIEKHSSPRGAVVFVGLRRDTYACLTTHFEKRGQSPLLVGSISAVLRDCESVVLGDLAGVPSGPASPSAAIQGLRSLAPMARILVLSEICTGESILSALRAGAGGYLVAPEAPERIFDAVLALRRGECPLSPLATRHLVESLRRPSSLSGPPELSNREREIFDLLLVGLRYREIAERLFISIETVRSHIRRIYRKLAVSSRAELAARWLPT